MLARLIYYLGARGEAGLKNFMHAFCKANSGPGGSRAPRGKKSERVLDANVSYSVPTLCLIRAGSGEQD